MQGNRYQTHWSNPNNLHHFWKQITRPIRELFYMECRRFQNQRADSNMFSISMLRLLLRTDQISYSCKWTRCLTSFANGIWPTNVLCMVLKSMTKVVSRISTIQIHILGRKQWSTWLRWICCEQIRHIWSLTTPKVCAPMPIPIYRMSAPGTTIMTNLLKRSRTI